MAVIATIVALVGAGVLYQQIGARLHRRRFRPPGEFVQVGGHRLHVTCRGSGAPLVLFESGIAASSLSWAAVQPEVARFTRACAYDRAGLAWSDPPSCPRTFDRIVDELRVLLETLSAGERVVLVGHSFGCFVVRTHAALHPWQVAGCVLVDPPTEWLTPTDQRARMLWGARHLSRIGWLLAKVGVVRACLALLTGGAPAAPRRFVKVFGPTAARTLERLVGEVRKLPEDVHPLVQALWCQPKCFSAMAEYLQALERAGASMARHTPPPGTPITVISSRDQPDDQVAAHRALAEAAIDGRHIVAARSGHWILFDEPDLVVAAVRAMVDAARQQ